MLRMRSHPGWLYVAGTLDDQPDHLLQLEDELDAAIAAVAKRKQRSRDTE